MTEIDKSKLAFTLSHSSLELLVKCPYAFYQRYIMKYYPEVEPNYSAEFGKLFHKVAEEYKGSGEAEVKELIEKYKGDFAITEEYELKIPRGIRNFLYFYNKYLVNAKKIYREKKITVLLNDFLGLTGSLDVLYQTEDGKWIITDYKSSKKRGDYSIQLSCYFYLLSLISKKTPEKITCQVVYLAMERIEDVMQEYVITLDDKNDYEQRLLTYVSTIMNSDVGDMSQWRKKPGPLCLWCDFHKAGICRGKSSKDSD